MPAMPVSWRDELAQRADQPPRAPRVPLFASDAAGGGQIGSVEPQLFIDLRLPASLVREHGGGGWQVQGDMTASLDAIARTMHNAGVAHSWRGEQLAVTDDKGRNVATVERAAVRLLGITTFAVHLAGTSPGGLHWIQQRSATKAYDPGKWDTLMGGMVPASDSLEAALERETWEEAGLRIAQLQGLRHGGRVLNRRRVHEDAAGYVVEWIDWYTCVVPDGVLPRNQDGEVERFALVDDDELARKLLANEFTLEAALVLSAIWA